MKRRHVRLSPAKRTFRPTLEALEDRALPAVTINSSFAGMNFNDTNGFVPPDTIGAIGPTHFVEMVNDQIAFFDRSTGNRVFIQSLDTFFTGATGLFVFDPVVTYDNISNRFYAVALETDFVQSSHLFLAVSNTSDPTQGFSEQQEIDLVQNVGGNQFFADYPKLGYNADAVVFTFNMFNFSSSGPQGNGVQILSINKPSLLDQNSGTLTDFKNSRTNQFTMAAAVMHDAAPGDPMWFTEADSNTTILVTKMDNVLSNTATFTETSVTVPFWDVPPRGIPQGGGDNTQLVDPSDGRMLNAAMQGGHLVTTQSIAGAAGTANARWYDFNATISIPSLAQSGTINPGFGISTYMPSIEIAPSGNMGMTYMETSQATGEFISMYVTGRQVSDPLGTMQTPVLVKAGESVYTDFSGSPFRQGDYSGITIDPNDTTQFWAANEYATSDATSNWGTWIASFRLQAIPPVANPDTYSITRNIGNNPSLVVPAPGVMGNDVESNGLPLTASLVTTTTHGTLAFSADGSFSYRPNLYYFGTDSFTYKDNDGLFDSNVTTVTINVTFVDAPPIAVNDGVYLVHPGVPFTLNAPGVLANDSDPDNDPLTAILTNPANKGTISLSSNGSFTYTASPNTTGSDYFTYVPFDGVVRGNTGTVSIHINTPPVARNKQFFTIFNSSTSGNVLTNDTDFDHDPLTAKLVSTTSNGTLTLLSNGTFSYTPNSGFFGIDTFTYKDNDGWDDGNTATVSIRVDRLPVANPDSYTIKQDATLEVFYPGVLSNDTDPDTQAFGDILSAHQVTAPANGTLTLATNGYLKYVPNPGFVGNDTFTYQVNDGMFNGNIAQVTIHVKAAPIAVPDTYSTLSTVISVGAMNGVLANDISPNMTPLAAQLVTNPTHGSLTFNPDGSFTYVATSSFHGVDSFTYLAKDSIYDSNVAQVTLNVFNNNLPPIANNDAFNVAAGVPTTIPSRGVLANDTDPDDPASSLTATLVNGPKYGSLLLLANGGFVYTPNSTYNGYDSFTYQASDSQSLSNVATVTLTVGTPPPPLTNPNQRIVEGQDTGGTLKVFAGETGNALFSITPYGNFTGAIRVATGDLNGDGVPDIITAPGAQTGTAAALPVRVFSGVNGAPLSGILGTGINPYGTSYRGGIEVAVGDVNGDGTVDIVTGADLATTTPQVRTFNGNTGLAFTNWFGSFSPYTGTAFGGVRVATGDVNGDGKAEIIVAPGAGTPTVKVYNPAASTLALGLLKSFSAFSTAQSGGVYITAGDLNGDGKAEIIVGGSSSSPGQVREFNGTTGTVIRSLSIAGTTSPARVAVGDINGDGKLDLVVGIANGSTSRARVYDAVTLTEMFGTSLFNYAPGYTGGLFVAALAKSSTTSGGA